MTYEDPQIKNSDYNLKWRFKKQQFKVKIVT